MVNAGADQTLTFGSPVSISATFTDPGTLDTWTYTLNWGDGTPLQSGSATLSAPITGTHQYLVPGNQTTTVCVTDDDLGKHCDSVAITFVSTKGKITGGTLRFGNNGRGGFNVQSVDGITVQGNLQYQNGSENLHAPTMTAIAVSPDLTKGWFSGVLKDGRVFVAYVEDNGEPGKNDIYKLWINGVLQNGDGKLTGGNIQIHKS
ncbi:MAG: Mg-chelatase subunit ChlD [Dehalococcoidia bacterium]|nr:Mg-chelatase subunit ChlD [Dehalococcoidia bacterium]